MNDTLRKTAKKISIVTGLYDYILKIDHRRRTSGNTKLDLMANFPAYMPNSAGYYKEKEDIIIKEIAQLPESMYKLTKVIDSNSCKVINIDEYTQQLEFNNPDLLEKFKSTLTEFGSDKATTHNYYRVYGSLFSEPEKVNNILEIGLGTNNTDVVSNMGRDGSPGASLRAFREFFSNANIVGCDFDERVLFQEERINTYYVDQQNANTFNDINDKIGAEYDLMIDDGLHSPVANMNSLAFFLPKLKQGGYAVIEDIQEQSLDFWRIVHHMLKPNYSSHLIKARTYYMFVVKKL